MDDKCKKFGFDFVDDKEIEFYCEPSHFLNFNENDNVYVSGSFNNWLTSADAAWKLNKKIAKNVVYYSLKKKIDDVMIPGNSGFPEFKFFGISNEACTILEDIDAFEKNTFNTNRLLFQTDDDFNEIQKIKNSPDYVKSLSDFDLNCPACRADIANIRLVPGTASFFRSYNPFKRSKPDFDTEDERIELVEKAYNIYEINSDITLNGAEIANEMLGEKSSPAINTIEKKRNRLCINIDYNLVYYHPDAVDFSCAMQQISHFIIKHPAPFCIHCRLGSDRTGVICAVFAALCGATWKDIAHDYERTTNMGVREYRSKKLLQYSLTKMLGHNVADSKDLAHLMQSYFIKENILTMNEISQLIAKLLTPCQNIDDKYFDLNEHHICAKKDAKKCH